MPTGAGLAAAGVSLAGYGTVDTATAPPTTIYVDATTGEQCNARAIDPYTGRYTTDSYGRSRGMRGVRQKVLLAVKTLKNTGVLPNFGNGVLDIQRRGKFVERELEDTLRDALKFLTDAGEIEINSVELTPFGASGEYAVLRWTDLTTSDEQETRF